jgi:hypothetical protein
LCMQARPRMNPMHPHMCTDMNFRL